MPAGSGYSFIIDDIANAVNGYGKSVDINSEFGITTGPAVSVTVHGGIVCETGVTGGTVALQLGIAGASGIVWQTPGTAVTAVAGTAVTVTAPTSVAGATHARLVVVTPITGGKITGVICK